MSKQTEALKLALEALEHISSHYMSLPKIGCMALAAVEEALAEQPAQQEPVSLPEKIYEFVPTPEPVKWHHPECEGQCIACLIEQVVQEAYGSQGLGYLQRHLTSPPASKPLTDEQIKEGWRKLPIQAPMSWSAYLAGARMAEAAHGITGEQHG